MESCHYRGHLSGNEGKIGSADVPARKPGEKAVMEKKRLGGNLALPMGCGGD